MRFPAAAFALLMAACATTPVDDMDPAADPPGGPAGPSDCPSDDIIAQRCGPAGPGRYLSLRARPGASHDEVVLVDSVEHSTCPVVEFPATTPVDGVTSLASLGTDLVFCATDAGHDRGAVTRVSLVDGSVITATMDCISTTAYGGRIVVLLGTEPTQLDLVDSIGFFPLAEHITVPGLGTRLGYGDDKIYSTFPSPSSVLAYAPATGTSTHFAMAPGSIEVMGLAGSGGALTILDGEPYEQHLITVDAATGAPLGDYDVGPDPTSLHGLTNTCSGTGKIL